MFKIDVKINQSFRDKTDPRKMRNAQEQVVNQATNDLLVAVKDEAPVRTGTLRDGHYAKISHNVGYINNKVEYAPFVIYGTRRMSANNYPQRAKNELITADYILSLFEQYYDALKGSRGL